MRVDLVQAVRVRQHWLFDMPAHAGDELGTAPGEQPVMHDSMRSIAISYDKRVKEIQQRNPPPVTGEDFAYFHWASGRNQNDAMLHHVWWLTEVRYLPPYRPDWRRLPAGVRYP